MKMIAKQAKRYNKADLVPGQPFEAAPGDVRLLVLLGWAEDAPAPVVVPVVPKPLAKPLKSGTYQTAALKPTE